MIFTPFTVVTLLLAAAVAAVSFTTGRPTVPLVSGAGLWLLVTGAGVCFQRLRFFGPVVCRQKKGARGVLLTFDDGPDPDTTPMVLDWLERHKVRGLFFLVGRKAAAHPGLVRRILSRGHAVGSHTDNHFRYTNFLTGRRLADELAAGIKNLENAGAGRVRWFRYPMGLTNPSIVRQVRKQGLTAVGWNRRCFDTQTGDVDLLVRRLKNARHGDIVLLHDAGNHVPAMLEALERVLPLWRERGVVTADPELEPPASLMDAMGGGVNVGGRKKVGDPGVNRQSE